VKVVSSAPADSEVPPKTRPPSNTLPLAEHQWRRAVLALRDAQRAYCELLEDRDAPDRLVDLAWLDLWRAERHRDHILAFTRDSEDD
jgi:hypothetical protein